MARQIALTARALIAAAWEDSEDTHRTRHHTIDLAAAWAWEECTEVVMEDMEVECMAAV